MAGSPEFKVYDAQGEYQASTKEIEAAAALVAFYGNGATIRWQHSRVVWTEGSEPQPAAESYDNVANVVSARRREIQINALAKVRGVSPEQVRAEMEGKL